MINQLAENHILQNHPNLGLELLIEHRQIAQRASEIGKNLTERVGSVDILVCIKNGAEQWADMLEPHLDVAQRLDTFIDWHEGDVLSLTTDGALKKQSLDQKRVLVVDDIIASGEIMSYILLTILEQNPLDLSICTLANKPEDRLYENAFIDEFISYEGFTLNSGDFVVGCGIGWEGLPDDLRKLQNIYRVEKMPPIF